MPVGFYWVRRSVRPAFERSARSGTWDRFLSLLSENVPDREHFSLTAQVSCLMFPIGNMVSHGQKLQHNQPEGFGAGWRVRIAHSKPPASPFYESGSTRTGNRCGQAILNRPGGGKDFVPARSQSCSCGGVGASTGRHAEDRDAIPTSNRSGSARPSGRGGAEWLIFPFTSSSG